jgi:hypothetical protein
LLVLATRIDAWAACSAASAKRSRKRLTESAMRRRSWEEVRRRVKSCLRDSAASLSSSELGTGMSGVSDRCEREVSGESEGGTKKQSLTKGSVDIDVGLRRQIEETLDLFQGRRVISSSV